SRRPARPAPAHSSDSARNTPARHPPLRGPARPCRRTPPTRRAPPGPAGTTEAPRPPSPRSRPALRGRKRRRAAAHRQSRRRGAAKDPCRCVPRPRPPARPGHRKAGRTPRTARSGRAASASGRARIRFGSSSALVITGPPKAASRSGPVLLHANVQLEEYLAAEQPLDLLPRLRPDLLEPRPTLSDHDRLLAVALDDDGGGDADANARAGLALRFVELLVQL